MAKANLQVKLSEEMEEEWIRALKKHSDEDAETGDWLKAESWEPS